MIAVTSTVFKDGEQKYFLKNTEDVYRDAYFNSPNSGMVAAMQLLYERYRNLHDIIVFMHDDCECLDTNWHGRIQEVFDDDPKTAIVGFGGATGIGIDDIYKTPYHISQLQRIDYYSNQVGWEIHGKQETGVRDVATVDGFCMAVRTAFLKETNGWSFFPFAFHNYDNALSLEAHRRGWKVKMVGVNCDHHGGATSTSAEYWEWCKENGTTPELEHLRPHSWMYERYRDLLPLRIGA